MNSRIDLGHGRHLTQTSTARRATEPDSRAQFRGALGQAAHSALQTLERAVPFVGGGVSVTSAISGVSGNGGASGAGGLASTSSLASDSSGSSIVQESAEQSYQLLALQQQIGNEQRQFTTFSNVMKARHDSVKNVIGNVR